ncbi:hypothetical protein [Desulfonatronum thioautotrophicum]|uniref:hypothetical protein n=1 Tax=Desulfonatronum thioautotrophicum TaxID=617001 RepID=UPI00069BAA89|nr:hypothetical protein [Desulfonatronum thioautotrophicum]
MALLEEYALTHCVFDAASYADQEIGRVYLERLKETLLTEGVVRDLRDGEWSRVFNEGQRMWHLMGRELFKKLETQNRLAPCPAISKETPFSDEDWCREAIASYQTKPFTGIVTSFELAQKYKANSLVASINRLSSASWWKERSCSCSIRRNKEEYLRNLEPLFRCANSVMFIDGHMDPSEIRYQDFISLLGTLTRLNKMPKIEIHRGCYKGSGPNRKLFTNNDLNDIFRIHCKKILTKMDFEVEVFIWDEIHDRYIITDIIGILMGNGLDTSKSNERTTWARLGRNERDEIQRRYDPDVRPNNLKYRFSLP